MAFERVEDRLDHEQVDASVAQSGDLLLVRLTDLIEGHRSVRGVLDARRERERDVQRAERAGDEARPLGRTPRPLVGRLPGEPRAFEAHLGSYVPEVVVRLPDAGRREGVRGRDVGARGEVRVVDLRDDLRVGQVQEIRVALDVLVVIPEALTAVFRLRETAAVDEHAPRAVEHEDALGEQMLEVCSNVFHENGSRLKRSGAGRLAKLFRRLVTRSPSCRSKLSG